MRVISSTSLRVQRDRSGRLRSHHSYIANFGGADGARSGESEFQKSDNDDTCTCTYSSSSLADRAYCTMLYIPPDAFAHEERERSALIVIAHRLRARSKEH
jgi:hypothetical protein